MLATKMKSWCSCGRTRDMREIAKLYAAIIQGVDLTPTDQMDALLLLGGLQQMQRLTHVVDMFKNAMGIPAGTMRTVCSVGAVLRFGSEL